jgi:outer membrane lipoprotein-sorting protein
MNNPRAFLIGLAFVLPVLPAVTQTRPMSPADALQVSKRISEVSKSTLSIEAKFIQTKELSVIKEKIISRGIFFFKKEKLLRWEYTAPFPYLVIFNNDRIYVKDEDRENHINIQSNKVFREINNILIGAVKGTLLSDSKNFQCSITDLHDLYESVLVPKNTRIKETLSEIILYFNKSDYTVEKLVLREVSGDYTIIEFSDKKINQNFGDEKFAIP